MTQHKLPKLLIGDWLIITISVGLVIWLFTTLWRFEPATKLQIRQGNKVFGTYSLNQTLTLNIHGPLGESIIYIKTGQARFVRSPCNNQYCVHQGWLTHAGQAAVCLPNQVSLELLGAKKAYDSLNY